MLGLFDPKARATESRLSYAIAASLGAGVAELIICQSLLVQVQVSWFGPTTNTASRRRSVTTGSEADDPLGGASIVSAFVVWSNASGALGQYVGMCDGCSWRQRRPFHVHMSVKTALPPSATVCSPPTSTVVLVRRSNAMDACPR